MSPAVIALVVTALAIALGAVALGATTARGPTGEGTRQPWWSTQAVWVGLSVAVLVLGLFVFPRLLGFTFLLLPLIWMRSGGRRPGQRPGGRPGPPEE